MKERLIKDLEELKKGYKTLSDQSQIIMANLHGTAGAIQYIEKRLKEESENAAETSSL